MSNITEDLKGLIFNIQRFSLHDGPGIRTTIFFKGCPLKCLWCHNPEGINSSKEILYKDFSCIQCEQCIKSCPNNAISLNETQIFIDREKCNLCGICVDNCQTNSLEICGMEMSVKEVFKELVKDREFYSSSNGGITISGGEPLMQFSFLKNLIKKLKENNLHVCVDTSGYIQKEKFTEILNLIDLVLFDVKTLDKKRHENLTGVSNELILKNLKQILHNKIDVIIRTPIIKGYNFINLPNELRRHIDHLHNLGFADFEFIPYHRFGEQKYNMIGKEYHVKINSNEYDLIELIAQELEAEYQINIKVSQPILT